MKKSFLSYGGVSCFWLAAALPADVSAQDAFELDEIVVTAQRRAQSLQDVPVSVSALNASLIEDAHIEELQDYANLVPNFTAIDLGRPGTADLSIRGVSNIGGQASSVAVYYDELGVSTSDGIGFDLDIQDIERIEVLRGPQGTLFGRNTIGGAVNIVTAKPENETSLKAEVDVSSYDTYAGKLTLNTPLVADKLLARVNVGYSESGGYIRDIGPADNTNDYKKLYGRFALRYVLDNGTIDLSIAHSDTKQGIAAEVPTGVVGPAVQSVGILQGFDSGEGFFPNNTRTIATDLPSESNRDATTVVGRLTYDFSTMRAVFVGGVQTADYGQSGDFDRTPNDYTVIEGIARANDLYSLEGRIESLDEGPWNWLVGGAYNLDKSFLSSHAVFHADFFSLLGLPPFLAPFNITDLTSASETSTYAAFGQLGWSSSDGKWDASLSVRYTQDKIAVGYADDTQSFVDLLPAGIRVNEKDTFSDFTPRLSVMYHPTDDLNLYATVSRGYKAGGFNVAASQVPGAPVSYGKETAMNYELGVKADLFARRLRVNAAFFHMDWDDIQVMSLYQDPSLVFYFFTQNAAAASVNGFEIEVQALPMEHLELNASLGYNDGKFDTFENAINDVGGVYDASGYRLPRASKWQGAVSAEVKGLTLGSFEGFVRAEYSYNGDLYSTSENRNAIGDFIGSNSEINLRAGVRGETVSIVAYAENIGGGGHAYAWDVTNFLSGYQAIIRPERFGIRLSYSY